MMRQRKPTNTIGLFWMGQRFQVAEITRPLSVNLRNRVTVSRRYEFQHRFVNVYVIGHPCEEHRIAAIAHSYNIAPDITIEAIYD